ncbi:hypothetical protein M3Y95_00392400 [Aphelenchoides besseyi]|nr:hypothetical protein M3Y95_00392400 [Aphelenchoides besseyi]
MRLLIPLRRLHSRRFASTQRDLDVREVEAEKPKVVRDYASTKANCAVFGVGLTKSGALAIPSMVRNELSTDALLRPTRIVKLNTKRIRKVAAGFGFSLFASDFKLYGAGLNNHHQLGGPIGRQEDYFIHAHPIELPGNPKILSISAGRLHSLIGTADGIYAFGDNAHGQCGLNPEDHPTVGFSASYLLPRLPLPGGCRQVHCSLDSSFVLTEAGELYAFGLSTDGQLGTGCSDIDWKPRRVPIDEEVKFVGGSSDTMVAVTYSGNLYIWGQVEYEQMAEFSDEVHLRLPTLVDFDFDSQPIRSAATTGTSCIVSTQSGRVFTWGSMFLGSGPTVRKSSRPISLSSNLFSDSSGRNGNVKRVFAGLSTVAALNEANHLFTWGANRHGALGLGHDRDQLFPFQVFLTTDVKTIALGPDHTLILSSSYYN